MMYTVQFSIRLHYIVVECRSEGDLVANQICYLFSRSFNGMGVHILSEFNFAGYCDERVCLCVCLSLPNTFYTSDRHHIFSASRGVFSDRKQLSLFPLSSPVRPSVHAWLPPLSSPLPAVLRPLLSSLITRPP